MTATRARVVAEARRWVGTPFVHQGRNEFGVDCIGLLLVTYGAFGLDQGFAITGYGRTPHGNLILRMAEERLERIEAANRLDGDVIVLRYARDPQHLGIVTPRGIIHAYPHYGVCEVSMPAAWESRVVAAFHVPGVV